MVEYKKNIKMHQILSYIWRIVPQYLAIMKCLDIFKRGILYWSLQKKYY